MRRRASASGLGAEPAGELGGRRHVVVRVLERVEELEREREVVRPLLDEGAELLRLGLGVFCSLRIFGEDARIDRAQAERRPRGSLAR